MLWHIVLYLRNFLSNIQDVYKRQEDRSMNYDRIILELLDRVSALEDEVKKLKEERTDVYKRQGLRLCQKVYI